MDELTGRWRKLYDREIIFVRYPSTYTVRLIKRKTDKAAERKHRSETFAKFWFGSLKQSVKKEAQMGR
jgi:hypothetical protein